MHIEQNEKAKNSYFDLINKLVHPDLIFALYLYIYLTIISSGSSDFHLYKLKFAF